MTGYYLESGVSKFLRNMRSFFQNNAVLNPNDLFVGSEQHSFRIQKREERYKLLYSSLPFQIFLGLFSDAACKNGQLRLFLHLTDIKAKYLTNLGDFFSNCTFKGR
jgi:hypothetical protein